MDTLSLLGIILPTIKLKVYTFWGLRTQQLRLARLSSSSEKGWLVAEGLVSPARRRNLQEKCRGLTWNIRGFSLNN